MLHRRRHRLIHVFSIPNFIGSMYDIFTHVWLIHVVHVGIHNIYIYTIHGCYATISSLKKHLAIPFSSNKNIKHGRVFPASESSSSIHKALRICVGNDVYGEF